jgi:hypothetical protein
MKPGRREVACFVFFADHQLRNEGSWPEGVDGQTLAAALA